MVNDTADSTVAEEIHLARSGRTRSRVLEALKAAANPLSGEELGEAIGVSRVAVWKAIQALTRFGYRIDSAHGGYRLVESPKDALYPWEFSEYPGTIRRWDETDSTMNRAREAALEGARSGTVVLAERQSAGRGTKARTWESPAGGLFFTVITRPTTHVTEIHREVLRMQCALAESLASRAASRAGVLWPNDVAVRSGAESPWEKAAGVLAEYLVTGSSVEYLALGVGVNTGTRPSIPGAASVSASRADILRDALAPSRESPGELVKRWNALCPLVGKPVDYSLAPGAETASAEGARTGVFLGTDYRGFARIADTDGEERSFPPGMISLLNKGRKP